VIATEGSNKESDKEVNDGANGRKASDMGMAFQMIGQECKCHGHTWMLAWLAWALALGVELRIRLNARMIVYRVRWRTNARSTQKTLQRPK
jgi:hypothetical protein